LKIYFYGPVLYTHVVLLTVYMQQWIRSYVTTWVVFAGRLLPLNSMSRKDTNK